MKLLVAVLVMAMAVPALAGPYLISDPSSDNATSCVFESFPLPCVIDAAKAINVDLATIPVGSYAGIRAKYCVQGGAWCSEWSNPFSFVRPSLSGPKNIKLSK